MPKENHGQLDNQQLITIIERIEKLNEETAGIAADIKEIYTEAKSAGYDPKIHSPNDQIAQVGSRRVG